MKDIQDKTNAADLGGNLTPNSSDEVNSGDDSSGKPNNPSDGGMEYLQAIVENMSPEERKTMLNLLQKSMGKGNDKMTGELSNDEGVEPLETGANSTAEYQGGR